MVQIFRKPFFCFFEFSWQFVKHLIRWHFFYACTINIVDLINSNRRIITQMIQIFRKPCFCFCFCFEFSWQFVKYLIRCHFFYARTSNIVDLIQINFDIEIEFDFKIIIVYHICRFSHTGSEDLVSWRLSKFNRKNKIQ